jgi:hypothetical protein
VNVVTGNLKHAGTDANVTLRIVGSAGTSAPLELLKSQHKNKFERNQTDTFSFKLADLGELRSIHVASDMARGVSHLIDTQWYLEKVVITSWGKSELAGEEQYQISIDFLDFCSEALPDRATTPWEGLRCDLRSSPPGVTSQK